MWDFLVLMATGIGSVLLLPVTFFVIVGVMAGFWALGKRFGWSDGETALVWILLGFAVLLFLSRD